MSLDGTGMSSGRTGLSSGRTEKNSDCTEMSWYGTGMRSDGTEENLDRTEMSSDGTRMRTRTGTVPTASISEQFYGFPVELITKVIGHSLEGLSMDERAIQLGKLRATSRGMNSLVMVSFNRELLPVISTRVTNDTNLNAYKSQIAAAAHCLLVVSDRRERRRVASILMDQINTEKITKLLIKPPNEVDKIKQIFSSLSRQDDRLKNVRSACVDLGSLEREPSTLFFSGLRTFLGRFQSTLREIGFSNHPLSYSSSLFRAVPQKMPTVLLCSPSDEMLSQQTLLGFIATPQSVVESWVRTRDRPYENSFTLVLPRGQTKYTPKELQAAMVKAGTDWCSSNGHGLPDKTTSETWIQCTASWASFEAVAEREPVQTS
ncbi:hypothetical protein BCR39DRAFT_591573 [Naematelia encephala]|uniref:Uncharacterized protein n=1 Tax=Naematelia encephala TaxID=71784 RepID=A0A1Y2AFX6_9TREE|nr:hypothetical protein BCR39DRAFT_591573 [Naematelia encephala]